MSSDLYKETVPPVSASTLSEKVITKFAPTATEVAPSAGDRELTTGGLKTPAYSKEPISVSPFLVAPLSSSVGIETETLAVINPPSTATLLLLVIANV